MEGLAGWIQETPDGRNAIMIAPIAAGVAPLELLALADGGIEGVQLGQQQLGFVSSGTLGFLSLDGVDGRWQ